MMKGTYTSSNESKSRAELDDPVCRPETSRHWLTQRSGRVWPEVSSVFCLAFRFMCDHEVMRG